MNLVIQLSVFVLQREHSFLHLFYLLSSLVCEELISCLQELTLCLLICKRTANIQSTFWEVFSLIIIHTWIKTQDETYHLSLWFWKSGVDFILDLLTILRDMIQEIHLTKFFEHLI